MQHLKSGTLGLWGFLWRGRRLLVNISYPRPWPVCRKACGEHEASNRFYCGAGRLGSSRLVALGNEERRPSLFVVLFPDVNVGAAFRQQFHNRRKVAVRRSVHRGVAVVVHGVDVRAKVKQELCGFQRLGLRAGLFQRVRRAEAGRRHQGRGVVGIPQEGVCAQFAQQTHQGKVRPVSSHQERSRPFHLK